MGLEDSNIVDAVGTDPIDGTVVLSLIDARDWSHSVEHLEALQAKLNSYIRFIEAGELLESYPAANGRIVVVQIFFRCEPPTQALDFLRNASDQMESAGIVLRYNTA